MYKCSSLKNNRVFISRHVVFEEIVFPYTTFHCTDKSVISSSQGFSSPNIVLHPTHFIIPNTSFAPSNGSARAATPFTSSSSMPLPQSESSSVGSSSHPQVLHSSPSSLSSSPIISSTDLSHASSNLPITPVAPVSTPIPTISQNNIFKPNPKYAHAVTKHTLSLSIEPSCVSRALKDSN